MISVAWAEPSPTISRPPMIQSVARIIDETCQRHGISRALLVGQRRQRPLVLARHEAMYRCVMETPATYPEIGRAFGGRDHTTVIHAKRAHEARMAANNSTTNNAAPNGGPYGSNSDD